MSKKATVVLDPLQKGRRGAAPAPPNGVRRSEPPYGGGDRIPWKKGHLLQAPPVGMDEDFMFFYSF